MALNKLDSQHQARDEQKQRISFGTLTGEHLLNGSVDNTALSGIVDDQDSRIIYGFKTDLGGAPFSVNQAINTPWDVRGSSTKINGLGSGVKFYFKGTSIGIIGRFNKYSSNIRVYVDGVETSGRALTFTSMKLGSSYYNPFTPFSATATTLYTDINSPQTIFGPGPGLIQIGREVIGFTTASTVGGVGVLDGLTRGVNGSPISIHTSEESIYLYTSRPGAFGDLTSNYGLGQLLWLKTDLSDGQHLVEFYVMDDATTGNSAFWFDGFIVGPVIGSSQIYHNVGTVQRTVTTDANGYADLYSGTNMTVRTGASIIGFLGYNQISPDPTTGATLAKLICLPDTTTNYGGSPRYAIVNGAASTTYTIQIVFSYLVDVI